MDSEQIKKVVVKAVLKKQILVKGGAEINKDLLKIVPFFKKKKKDYQIPKLGKLALSRLEVEILKKVNRESS